MHSCCVVRARYLTLIAAAVILATVEPAQVLAIDRAPLVLLTPAEAAQLRMDTGDWPRLPRLRSVGAGPRIVFQQPSVQEAEEAPTVRLGVPASLVVKFEQTRAPVDMSSLDVTAKKSFFSKSLTGLLKPYVRGTTLEVGQLEIPTGSFLIEVSIADTEGMATTANYRFDVAK